MAETSRIVNALLRAKPSEYHPMRPAWGKIEQNMFAADWDYTTDVQVSGWEICFWF